MKKEDKKEISIGTTAKAIITGYVAYGVLIGFVAYILGIIINWCLNSLPNTNMNVISVTVPLLEVIFLCFIVRGICSLSIHDVFRKCKTNPENISRITARLNLFIMITIAVFVVGSVGILILNLNSEEKSIVVSSYQYKTIHSEEFAADLTNDMLEKFAVERNHKIVSTIILELGIVVSLFSAIPLQKKLITELNEF